MKKPTSKTVLRMRYGNTPYRIDRREMFLPEENRTIKRFHLVEGEAGHRQTVYVTRHFGDCIYFMFNREEAKTKTQLTLTGE